MFELGIPSAREQVKQIQIRRFSRFGEILPFHYVCDDCKSEVVVRCPVAYEPQCGNRCGLPEWRRHMLRLAVLLYGRTAVEMLKIPLRRVPIVRRWVH